MIITLFRCLCRHLALFAMVIESACCANAEDIVSETDLEGIVDGAMLEEVRRSHTSEEGRCEAACEELLRAQYEGAVLETLIGCHADGDVLEEMPFAPENGFVYVYCVGLVNHGPGFCG